MAFWNKQSNYGELQAEQYLRNSINQYIMNSYYQAIQTITLPLQTLTVSSFVKNTEYFIWKDVQTLFVLRNPEQEINKLNNEDIQSIVKYDDTNRRNNDVNTWLKIFLLYNIKFFKHSGQIETETKISGGGGGGSSIGGAVVGGLIAGDVGAIIGSRKKVEPIKSETRTWDMRRVELHYVDENGDDKHLSFTPSAYEVFMELIPEKQYDYVMSQKLPKPEQTTETKSTKDRLTELQGLLNDGLITQDEYDQKRQAILENL